MKKVFVVFLVGLFVFPSFRSVADEGMWLPLLIQKLNMNKMQQMGLKLSAEDIYSINKASLKDAVVALDHGSCTGELISADGLLLTNHHCGYDEIQKHSSLKHDYLTDGFWAMSRAEELPNPGKTVSFLVRIEDVTDQVNAVLTEKMTEAQRAKKVEEIGKLISDKAISGTNYEGKVQSFFSGNNYYLFVYQTFKDVRLVGAPPSSIGVFGGDTDNWVWPRHTGDFSMFRVYCAPDGSPAEYSEKNVPYHPKHFLPISLKGIEKGDFAMVMGYPGNTERFLTSWGVNETTDVTNKIRVKVRTAKLAIIKEGMESSDKVRIQYASKYRSSSNYWKYSIGQNKGIAALDVYKRKQELEKKLQEWVMANDDRIAKYNGMFSILENGYQKSRTLNKVMNYWNEALIEGPEIIIAALNVRMLEEGLAMNNPAILDEQVKAVKEEMKKLFKDYHVETDKKLIAELFRIYYQDVEKDFHPSVFADVEKKYKGDFKKYAEMVFKKSFLIDSVKLNKFLEKPNMKELQKDPGYQVMNSIIAVYFTVKPQLQNIRQEMEKGERQFAAALMEMQTEKTFSPDANSTMRLTYGQVGDYDPRDAVTYKYYTTLAGYIEKEDSTNEEFVVPKRLKELYYKKDFGRYAKNGELVTCFTTNNDITGGNSGSPVINGNGELIGTAFDGNWEAMSGDIVFEPKIQKTICVDIRFVLWVIDKYAGAGHLVKEMKIVE
jgi:hypothetical protein